jgi:hypothetical protein
MIGSGVAMREHQKRPAFERMEATLLACPRCRRAVPVRKHLLLILPEGDKYEYLCPDCGATCGTTVIKTPHGMPN